MTKEEIKKRVLRINWEFWADRPFGAFILSLNKGGVTRAYMKKAGVDADWPASLFENGAWFKNEKVWDNFSLQLEKHIKSGHDFFEITKNCESFYRENLPKIKLLAKQKSDPLKRLAELYHILTQVFSYVWLAHGFEHLYLKKLRAEVPKYVKGDTEKFIGDISFPVKKNAHNLMEEALKKGDSLKSIQNRFAWIKVRDGFAKGFTLAEFKSEKAKLKNNIPSKWQRPKIPKPLLTLAKIAQELVYFRTMRTDVLYEFLYIARPLFKAVAQKYSIPFNELKNYSVHDLLMGKPKKYPSSVTAITFGGEFALFTEPLLAAQSFKQTQIKGNIAYMGKVTGKVKIVKIAHEINKVKKGDILLAPTTFPSFIMGMKLAAAFVTDEGGLTSHAAIVAREMRKPCIIGTKVGTKIFKDGDMVEVNANTGIVKKI